MIIEVRQYACKNGNNLYSIERVSFGEDLWEVYFLKKNEYLKLLIKSNVSLQEAKDFILTYKGGVCQ